MAQITTELMRELQQCTHVTVTAVTEQGCEQEHGKIDNPDCGGLEPCMQLSFLTHSDIGMFDQLTGGRKKLGLDLLNAKTGRLDPNLQCVYIHTHQSNKPSVNCYQPVR